MEKRSRTLDDKISNRQGKKGTPFLSGMEMAEEGGEQHYLLWTEIGIVH